MKPQDNSSNMKNANKDSNGVNKQYSQVHGNRSKQLKQQGDKK
ncbi:MULTISPECIES: hypothetical protein [Pseudoalteromonas]|nr:MULTISPECIES: hypothetical protein [Pseudoalteromonas]MDW7548606.1 hypothetical protein [Pseudoalteromonas peptidolytica]